MVDFGLGAKARVAGDFAQARRAAEEDVGRRRFGHADKHGDEDGPRDPDDFPQGPAPSFGGNGKARKQRAKSGAAVGGCDPDGEGVGELEERVHVLHGGTAVGKARATEEALEEAKHEETGEGVDRRRRNRQDDEEQESDDVYRTSANEGDFAKRSEDQRPDAIRQDVEGQRQRCVGSIDTEVLNHAEFAGRVDCRAGVHGEGVETYHERDEATFGVGPVLRVGGIVGGVPVHQDVAVRRLLRGDGYGFGPFQSQFGLHLQTVLGVWNGCAATFCACQTYRLEVIRGPSMRVGLLLLRF